MKTAIQASKDSGIPVRLIRAVMRQTGKENLQDIANHGAGAGFAGFTYYSDTVAFYKRNRADIVEMAHRMADDMGEQLIPFIQSFRCLRVTTPADERAMADEIGRALYGRIGPDDTQAANALAWFAAEEVSRAMVEE